MTENEIPVAKPYYSEAAIDSIMEDMRKVLNTGRLVSGPYLQEFENKFSDYIGCREAVGMNSGTSALEVALRCINVEGREVITTTNTCTSVINAILFAGGKPVLVDISQETLAMDPEKLKEEIGPETRAVIPVHIAGNIQRDIDEIQDICKSSAIILVEDSCRALGAKRHGKLAGNFGDIACFSFYAAKLLSTGNGGMLTTNDIELSKKARLLREKGRTRAKNRKYLYTEIAHNIILDEFGSILGLSQLEMLEKFITDRIKVAKIYDKSIKKIDYLEKAIAYSHEPDSRNSYYRYPVVVNELVDPEHFEEFMNKKGVNLGHYFPMVHQTQVYRNKKSLIRYGELVNATFLSRRLFSLPIFNSISNNQVNKVIQSLVDYR